MEDITTNLLQSIKDYSIGNMLSALVTLAVCLLVVRLIVRTVTRVLGRTRLEDRARKYILLGIKSLLYILTAIIVADSLGVNMNSFVALLSVLSLGLTMAAEDTLGNFAGGLVILSSHPFKIGDFIESSGTTGTVDEINLQHTRLLNPDGHYILIPNKDLAASRIINYTALGRRRLTVKVSVSYNCPTEAAEDACRDAVDITEGILRDPEPAVWLTDYGSSGIEFTIFCWSKAGDYWKCICTLRRNLRRTFEWHHVTIPYNHVNVHLLDVPPELRQTETVPETERGQKTGSGTEAGSAAES